MTPPQSSDEGPVVFAENIIANNDAEARDRIRLRTGYEAAEGTVEYRDNLTGSPEDFFNEDGSLREEHNGFVAALGCPEKPSMLAD